MMMASTLEQLEKHPRLICKKELFYVYHFWSLEPNSLEYQETDGWWMRRTCRLVSEDVLSQKQRLSGCQRPSWVSKKIPRKCKARDIIRKGMKYITVSPGKGFGSKGKQHLKCIASETQSHSGRSHLMTGKIMKCLPSSQTWHKYQSDHQWPLSS